MSEDSIIVADGGDFVGSAAYILKPRGPLRWLDPGNSSTSASAAVFRSSLQFLMYESLLSAYTAYLFVAGAFGTLGVGGGFALGAKLCRPESEVQCLVPSEI